MNIPLKIVTLPSWIKYISNFQVKLEKSSTGQTIQGTLHVFVLYLCSSPLSQSHLSLAVFQSLEALLRVPLPAERAALHPAVACGPPQTAACPWRPVNPTPCSAASSFSWLSQYLTRALVTSLHLGTPSVISEPLGH